MFARPNLSEGGARVRRLDGEADDDGEPLEGQVPYRCGSTRAKVMASSQRETHPPQTGNTCEHEHAHRRQRWII